MNIRGMVVGGCLPITVLLLSCGCLGTYVSRTECLDKGNVVGKWPYQAVAQDVVVIAEPFRNNDELRREAARTFAVYGLVSIPVDLVCDTVVLPVDLVTWPFEFQKSPLRRRPYVEFVDPSPRRSREQEEAEHASAP